jgi:fido (protein-threonine AMPylation protein)
MAQGDLTKRESRLHTAATSPRHRSRTGRYARTEWPCPFLETNGRTLMTVHADLTRRAGFHIDWQSIGKGEFLAALTEELRKPGTALDRLLTPHILPGPQPMHTTAAKLAANPGLNPPGAANPPSGPQPGPRPQ